MTERYCGPVCLDGPCRIPTLYSPFATGAALSAIGMVIFADPVWAAASGAGASVEPFGDRLWRFLGALHPMVVHFPIALIVVGALAAVVRRTVWRGLSGQVVTFCLTLGMLGAIAAAVMGWSRAAGRTEEAWGTLYLHRWLGVAVAVGAVVVWGWAVVGARRWAGAAPAWSFVIAVAGLSGLVGFTGHLGGELVYPGMIEGALTHLVSPKPPIDYSGALTGPTPPAASTGIDPGASGDTRASAVGGRIDFRAQVWPILEAKCVTCHGPEQQKGDLRLDSEAGALAGGSSGIPAYEAGEPDESEMLFLITDPDEDFRMPPVGEGEAVTVEELRILRLWIEQGAEWSGVPVVPEAAGDG